MKEKKVTICLNLERNLLKKAREYAQEEEISLSALTRKALKQLIYGGYNSHE